MAKKQHKKALPVIGDPADPCGMTALLDRYLEWMRVTGYSEETVKTRQRHLLSFMIWCDERGIAQPREVTKPILDRYRRRLYHYRKSNGQPLSFRGQHGRLVPIRAFFKWLAKNNYILYNPASELELPRLERRLPKHVLTISEVEQVMNAVFERSSRPKHRKRRAQLDKENQEPHAQNRSFNYEQPTNNPLAVRDRAILETFYSTGMRRMELVNLKLYDLDAERGTVMIRQGKGKKDRMVPI